MYLITLTLINLLDCFLFCFLLFLFFFGFVIVVFCLFVCLFVFISYLEINLATIFIEIYFLYTDGNFIGKIFGLFSNVFNDLCNDIWELALIL